MTRLAALRAHSWLLSLLLLAAGASGCFKSCQSQSDVLATINAVSGGVLQKDEQAEPITWQSVGVGAQAKAGDALRTDDNATASLTLVDNSTLTLQPASLLRFRPAQDGYEPEVDLLSGEAFVQSGDKELPLHTTVGVAHLRPGARLQLTRSGNELHLLLQVGEATFRTLEGTDVELKKGESLKLEIGAAIIRETVQGLAAQVKPARRDKDPAPRSAVPQGGATSRAPHEQGVHSDGGSAEAHAADNANAARPEQPDPRQPAPPVRPSFVVPAGESFVVHAASLPVALGVSAPVGCQGETLVELNNGARFVGTAPVKLWLDGATKSYSTRCADKPARSAVRGSVRVLEDAGTRKLPPRAPMSNVDADGHGYTIYYQNQPPDIHVRWPNAPDTKAYELDVDGNVRKLTAPEHTFASGELNDGQHRLTFSALSRRSRSTVMEVHFDNTAATASLNTPQDRGFAPGTEVVIEGVVLPAWKVSVDGGTIEKVGESRFQGRITTSESRPDFAVRLSHRKLGTHYYVRRAAQ